MKTNEKERSELAIFPFDLIKFPTEKFDNAGTVEKEPFIEKVEKVLGNNVQDPTNFGCKINNCHTHAGSKIHFESFIEAELLFHNSYYNERFASLAKNFVSNELKIENIKNILLIGYENYSELFLVTLKNKIIELGKQCDYCVYMTESCINNGNRYDRQVINRLGKCNSKIIIDGGSDGGNIEFNKDETTLCLFIVPINTTLSTMDKMVAKFRKVVFDNAVQRQGDRGLIQEAYLCLITLYDKNEFFDLSKDKLVLNAKDKFETISNKPVRNFVLFEHKHSPATKCVCCFPNNNQYIKETPMFGVNRGSVVPMLKFGKEKYLVPIDTNDTMGGDASKKIKEKEYDAIKNLSRVWKLSEYMQYSHIFRGGNHFQFYFHTAKYLGDIAYEIEDEKKRNELRDWLDSLKGKYDYKKNDDSSNTSKDIQIFDYLIAPRHPTNAQFVYLVNKYVFCGSARIIFFEADKEYRSNLLAKYSDFIAAISNIRNSGIKYEVRFHYIDDVINSGATFLNAKNLISSLIKEADMTDEGVKLFYSAILLINRISVDRRNFYIPNNIGDVNSAYGFHYFINVKISPMRSHEDACTLCKLCMDYEKIRQTCATNFLAHICSDMIDRHKLNYYSEKKGSGYSSREKRFLFLITHLLNERLANILALKNETSVDTEMDEKGIRSVLANYYEFSKIKKLSSEDFFGENSDKCDRIVADDDFIWKIAFIKAISRPFFTYHIRWCQASFAFCLKKLNDIIDTQRKKAKKKLTNKEIRTSVLVQTLVKGLSDMNANYIIRQINLSTLIEIADWYYALKDKVAKWLSNGEERQYLEKRLFNQNSLLHYIKKDLVLSRDTTKSLLLEYILLTGKEDVFFGTENQSLNTEAEDDTHESYGVENFISEENGKYSLSFTGVLYLENNLILRKALKDDIDKLDKNPEKSLKFYFFENFENVLRLNLDKNFNGVLNTDFFEAYKAVTTSLLVFENAKSSEREDFSAKLNNLLEKLGASEMKTLAFLHDTNEENKLFQFFTVAGKPSESGTEFGCAFDGTLKTSQAFFHDDNLENIRKAIGGEAVIKKKKEDVNNDIFFIDDVLANNKKSLVIRFGLGLKDDYEGIEVLRCGDKQGENGKDDGVTDEQKNTQNAIREVNLNDLGNKPDNSIYFQIWGFNRKNQLHWFALKLFLTFRDDFVRLIQKVNLQELIEERKAGIQRAALAINKAATHGGSDKYVNFNVLQAVSLSDIDEVTFLKQYKTSMCVSNGGINTFSYDRYLQLLADEHISSLYRKIVKNEDYYFLNSDFTADKVERKLRSVFSESLKNATSQKDNKKVTKNSFTYTMQVPVNLPREIKICHVKFNFKQSSDSSHYICPEWFENGRYGIIWLTILMTANFAEHAYSKGNDKLDVTVYTDRIEYRNSVVNCDENELNKSMHIPPWVFKDNQHLTIWTMVNAKKYSDEEFLFFNVKIKNNVKTNDKVFTATYNFKKSEGKYE